MKMHEERKVDRSQISFRSWIQQAPRLITGLGTGEGQGDFCVAASLAALGEKTEGETGLVAEGAEESEFSWVTCSLRCLVTDIQFYISQVKLKNGVWNESLKVSGRYKFGSHRV